MILTVISSALGWLMFWAALCVINAMTPDTDGRAWKVPAWVLTAVVGFLFGVQPAIVLGAELESVRGTGSGGGVWSFTLYDESGVCSGQWKRSVYRQTLPTMEVEGCWTEQGDQVRLVFVDGDSYVIPRRSFRGGV